MGYSAEQCGGTTPQVRGEYGFAGDIALQGAHLKKKQQSAQPDVNFQAPMVTGGLAAATAHQVLISYGGNELTAGDKGQTGEDGIETQRGG